MPRMYAHEIHGERVYNTMLVDGPHTKRQLCSKLGLRPSQVEGGLRHIREVVANRESNPIVYDPHTGEYDLAHDERAAVRYLRYRLSILRRWVMNLNTGTLTPTAAKYASPSLDALRHQISMVESSISYAESVLA